MKLLLANWRTSLVGLLILAFCIGAYIGKQASLTEIIAGVVVAAGFFVSKDAMPPKT